MSNPQNLPNSNSKGTATSMSSGVPGNRGGSGLILAWGLAAFSVTWLVAWLFLLAGTALSIQLSLIIATIVAAFAAVYALAVAQDRRDLPLQRQHKIKPEEKVVRTTRRHRICLLVAAQAVVGGIFFLAVFVCVSVWYPAVHLSIPGFTLAKHHFEGQSFSIPIWEIPLIVALACLFMALLVWERWKWFTWTISDRCLHVDQDKSPYMVFMGTKNDPIPLSQIIDVKWKESWLGHRFKWGTVTLLIRYFGGADKIDKRHLTLVPHPEEFVDDLKSVLPSYQQPQQQSTT